METDGRTIIISTPEELFPLITEAVRLAGYENARNTSDCPNQKLLAPKDVEREFGIRQKTLAYWRQECIGPAYTSSAGAFSMNAPYWKNTSPPDASKPWTQSNDGFIRQAYPR